mgnify:FL=1
MNPILKRTLIVVVAIEIVYLVLVNTALNLQVTQDLINKIKPDKFAVSWDSAWTLYPTRVHARGVMANGQSRGQQWQVRAPEASASISLLRLPFKTVSLSNVSAEDVEYRQRPRPKPGKDYSATREFFPPIAGRELEITPPVLAPIKKGKKPWDIQLTDMHASGSHVIWLYQLQAKLNGELSADLSVQTRGGPLSVSNGEVDISLQSLVINNEREVTKQAQVKGTVELLPFKPKENKGLKALAFLNLDAEINTDTDSLAFLNLYLGAFQGMKVDGAGHVKGRVHFRQGDLQSGTKLDIAANELGMNILDYRVEGDGSVSIEVPGKKPENHIGVRFDSLKAFDSEGQTMFSGDGLDVRAVGNTVVVPLNGKRPRPLSFAVDIPSARVPDLKMFQRFLPEKWVFSLHGGEGELKGSAKLTGQEFNTELHLSSDEADMGFRDYRFKTNLDTYVRIDSPSLEHGEVDISGSYFKLDNAVLSQDDEKAKPWFAEIMIEKGLARLNLDDAPTGVSGARHLVETALKKNLRELMADADNELKVSGRISDLSWLNLFVKNPYNFKISGDGEISAQVNVDSGWLDEGTHLTIAPEALVVHVLDYQARGSGGGGVELKVIKGGEHPDMTLDVAVRGAQFGRKGDEQPFVEDIDILLQALGREVKFDGSGDNLELRLHIPSARVKDMKVYNQYLPADSPLKILDGEANLVADVMLKNDDADGFVRLVTEDMTARVDEQEIAAALTADIKLTDGVPKNMEFDISGSTIVLDKVNVIGDEKSFRDEDWSATFALTKGRTTWKRPVQLDLEAEVEMSDSMPIVSMLANKRGKHGWLEKALTIDDMKGDVRMQMANRQVVVPYAFAGSEKIDVGAKAIISEDNRNGVVYVRFRKLHGILKVVDGKRNVDVLKAREKFDNYSTDAVLSAGSDEK